MFSLWKSQNIYFKMMFDSKEKWVIFFFFINQPKELKLKFCQKVKLKQIRVILQSIYSTFIELFREIVLNLFIEENNNNKKLLIDWLIDWLIYSNIENRIEMLEIKRNFINHRRKKTLISKWRIQVNRTKEIQEVSSFYFMNLFENKQQ